jgi:hypothetical protein
MNQQEILPKNLITLINDGLFPLVKKVDPNSSKKSLFEVSSKIGIFGRAVLDQVLIAINSGTANDLYDFIQVTSSFAEDNSFSFNDIMNSTGPFSGCSIHGNDLNFYLITAEAAKTLGGIWKKPIGDKSIRDALNEHFTDLIELDTSKIQAFCFKNPFDLAINSGIVDDPYKSDHFYVLATCYDNQLIDFLATPKLTPPIGASELARRLEVSKSILSSDTRPLGKLFRKHSSEQNTKNPQIPYEELFIVARGFLVNRGLKINRINDLIEYLNL